MRALRLVYLALGAATAALNPFITVILAQRGMSPGEIGTVGAIGACALIGAIGWWGHMGDRVLGRRRTLQVCCVVAIGIALAIAMPVPRPLLGALVVAFGCSQGVLLALADSLAVNAVANAQRDYGSIRLLASLSFAITSIAVGFVYDRLGYGIASVAYVVFALALAVGAFGIPERGRERGAADRSKRRRSIRLGSTGAALQHEPQLLPILLAVAVTWSAVIVSFNFLSLRIVGLGGQASDVAMSSGVSAFAEIPGMLLAARLTARLGLRGLYGLGALLFGFAFLTWTFLTLPAAIVATRCITGVAYGGLTVAMVVTMRQLLPEHLQATGQTLYQGTATGIAAVAGNIAGGLLYGSAGPETLFFLCAVMCTLGGVLGFLALPGRVRLLDPTRTEP